MAVFHRNYLRKHRFSIFWIENNDYKTKTKTCKKGQKMDIFAKGVVHGFCPKIELFLIGVFHRNHIRKDGF